jgi:hypothetical protein
MLKDYNCFVTELRASRSGAFSCLILLINTYSLIPKKRIENVEIFVLDLEVSLRSPASLPSLDFPKCSYTLHLLCSRRRAHMCVASTTCTRKVVTTLGVSSIDTSKVSECILDILTRGCSDSCKRANRCEDRYACVACRVFVVSGWVAKFRAGMFESSFLSCSHTLFPLSTAQTLSPLAVLLTSPPLLFPHTPIRWLYFN